MNQQEKDCNHHSNKSFPGNGFISLPSSDIDAIYEDETSFKNNNDRSADTHLQNDFNPGCNLEEDFNLEQIPTFETVTNERGLANTQHLYTIRLRKPCMSGCCDCCNNVDKEFCEVPQALRQTKITNSDYSNALKHVSSSTKIRQYTFWFNRFLHIILYLLVFLSIWGLSLILWWKHGLHPELGITLFAVASISVVLVCYISCSCFRRKLNYTAKCALSKCNGVLLKYHVICTVMEEGAVGCYVVNLHFAYYNPAPCMERILQVLNCALVRKHKARKKTFCGRLLSLCSFPCQNSLNSSSHIKHSVIEETDFMLADVDISQTRIQEFAHVLLHHYSHRYLSALILNNTRKPFYTRHVPEKMCLCQYIEREFFHLQLDTISTIA